MARFHSLKIKDIRKETSDSVSIAFDVPAQISHEFQYKQGQYITVKLNATLKANTCYYGEFYTSLADICKLGTNRIGMYLSQNTFTTSLGSFTNTIQPQIEWDTTKYFTDTMRCKYFLLS